MGLLKKFKEKKCKTILCKVIQWLTFHHLTQMGIGILVLLVSGIVVGNMSEYNPAFQTWVNILIGSSVYLGIFVIVGLIFGLIINPIRAKREFKEKYDK